MEHRVPYIGKIRLTWLDYLNLGMGLFLLSQAGWHASSGEPVSYIFSGVLTVVGILVLLATLGLGRHKFKIEEWVKEQRESLNQLEQEWAESKAADDCSSQK